MNDYTRLYLQKTVYYDKKLKMYKSLDHVAQLFTLIISQYLSLFIYLQVGTRQEPHWVTNTKPTYCGSRQTLV